MSLPYKVVKQVFGFDETKTEKYVARIVTGEMLTFDKVRNQVCQITGVHRASANIVMEGLLDVLVNNMQLGHSVQLGEFGILRPAIRAKAKDNEKDANAGSIYRRRVVFVPGKMLKSFLNDVSVMRIKPEDTDYTDGTGGTGNGGGGNSGGGDDGGWVDPTA